MADTAAACVGLALLAAAALVEQQDRRRLTTSLPPGHVGAAVTSEHHFQIDGQPAGPGFAPLSPFWQTSNGWMRTHANYPWHRTALLERLNPDEDPQRIAAAIRALLSEVLEDQLVAAGGVAATVRAAPGWAAHAQGKAVASEPLIGYRSIPDA